MEALSVREYRNNLAASFTKADNGEQVLIRRKNEIYALVKVGREDLMITPELQARIDKAREEIKSGKCVTLKSSEDIDAYFDSLWCTQLGFPTGVDKVIAKWKKSNPNLFKKYKKIYKELLEHPKTGLGHPEALRGGGDITWSRHITAHDRIIYDIYEEVVEVYILEVEGHYNDKW